MCGIIGVWNFRSGKPVDRGALSAARDLMSHRGPDAAGEWLDQDIGLGHRRLSILDLSDAGRQPMRDRTGRYVISYNGEIYNYRELREQYLSSTAFDSATDTEVYLNLFAKLGRKAIELCNGMFAIAIWDRDQRKLYLTRDRVGIKPLYYTHTSDGIAFASEIKSLLALEGVDNSVDRARVIAYLNFGYIPGAETIFTNIRKVLPATTLVLSEDGIEEQRFWNLTYQQEQDRGLEAYSEEFGELFTSAIDLRLRSDVPLGIFLSGGLDSSAVVAQLSQFHTQQLKTFSVNYDFGPQYDESGYAREVATNFGTEHHEIQVTPTLFRDWITSYVWHMDEPVTEAAAISLHYVSALAKQHVTVVLSGEGADELLGGYDIYKYMWAIDRYRRVPKVLRKLVESPLGLLGNAKLNKYVALAQKPIESAYFGVSLYEPSKVAELVSDELRALHTSGHGATVVHNDQIDHPLNKMLDFDVRTWLVDNLLVKADKMTMASSLELRVPFLDYRLIEFCANLPVHYKINRGNKKFLLKHCMREHLPPSITQRKKVGFPTPLAMMFRTELHEYAADLLHSTAFKQRGLFSADTAQRWLTEHRDGQADHHRELWQLVALEEWFRVFVDRQLPTTA